MTRATVLRAGCRRAVGGDVRSPSRRITLLERCGIVLALALIAGGLTPPLVHPQSPPAKEIRAVRLSEPVTIDGVLDEAVWREPGATEFRRRFLGGNPRPSETTEVWVAYDERAIYVAVRCYDSEPSTISRTIGPRDADLEADWFMVSIDAYRDRRSGFFFRVTPGGAIQDGILYDDSRSDISWDGVWEYATATDSLGWTAEIRIPLSQLRFNPAPEQTWGINFTRRIHRTNEIVDFTAAPRGRRGGVSLFADLVGLRDLGSPVRLEVLPYMVAAAHDYQGQPDNPFHSGRDYATGFGADLKLGLGSGFTLDAAINPDFGHVEADPAVVNLTPNETFYQEKRPFFQEGTNIFDFGRGPGMRFFHSRRIGRAPQGSTSRDGFVSTPNETGILGAAKLTGKVGESWTVGWLNALTAREHAEVDVDGDRHFDEIEPLSYFGILRAQGSFDDGNRGLGVFTGAAVRDLRVASLRRVLNRNAWTGGVDGWWHLDANRRTSLEGWVGASHIVGTPEHLLRQQRSSRRYFQRPDAEHLGVDSTASALSGVAGQLRLTNRLRRLTTGVTLRAISPGFELNDLGYNSRSDLASADASIRYTPRRRDPFNRLTFGVAAGRQYDYGQNLLATSYSAFASAELTNFWGGSASVSYAPEGLDVRNTRGGPSMLSPAAWNASASLSSDTRNSVLVTASADARRDVEGSWSAAAGGVLSWYPSPRVALSLGPWWEKYFADAGYFTRRADPTATHTYGARFIFAGLTQEYLSTDVRLDWTFTPRLSLQLYAQPYFTNVRYDAFKELARPGSYDFLVYGQDGSTLLEEDGVYTIDPDGAGPGDPFTLYDTDFRFASLRGTTVLRWDYRAGSSLILAWTHDRWAYEDYWQDWRADLLEVHPDNRLMIKLTYWLSP